MKRNYISRKHIGSFDSEPESFHKLQEFVEKNHYERKTFAHKEIYLTDARKTFQEKMKTILRYSIRCEL